MQNDITVTVTKRAADLGRGLFKVGATMDLDPEDMVVYHKGVRWNVIDKGYGRYALAGSETILEASPLTLVEQGEDFATFSGVLL